MIIRNNYKCQNFDIHQNILILISVKIHKFNFIRYNMNENMAQKSGRYQKYCTDKIFADDTT